MITRRSTFVLVCLMLISLMVVACDNGGSPTPTNKPATPTLGVQADDSANPAATLRPPLPSATPQPSPTTTPQPLPISTSTPPPGTPLPSPTAMQAVNDLAHLVLQSYEVPAGLTFDATRSGEQSNETVANGDASRLQQLKTWGRQSGYLAVYRTANPPLTGTVSLLSSSAASFASADGATSAWGNAVKRLESSSLPLTALPDPPSYTEHTATLFYADPKTNIATAVLLVAHGHLVEEITIVGEKIGVNELYPLAQPVVARLLAAP
ncbi:MAG: hypothetical protein DLM69_01815 [Candidatus Chloroheliales bacterium]|nr:MAG: hypothetical protein DLM69_01815 [Chloroflexota bacterium]